MKNFKFKQILIPLISAGLSFLLFTQVLFLGYVPTESMEPTIHKNRLILANRLAQDYEVGDVIVFQFGGKYLVKRIAGTVGKTVETKDGYKVVPKDCYFVLGDNSDNSFDSRFWDDPFVKKDDVFGKVILPNTDR